MGIDDVKEAFSDAALESLSNAATLSGKERAEEISNADKAINTELAISRAEDQVEKTRLEEKKIDNDYEIAKLKIEAEREVALAKIQTEAKTTKRGQNVTLIGTGASLAFGIVNMVNSNHMIKWLEVISNTAGQIIPKTASEICREAKKITKLIKF